MTEMDTSYLGSTKCTQSFDRTDEVRSLIGRLDLDVDRKIENVLFTSGRGLEKRFRSSPELTTDSPMYHLQVVKIASPPVPALEVPITSEMDAHSEMPRFLRRQGPSLTDALYLAVDRRIAAIGLLQLRPRREHAASFRSFVKLSVRSPVYGAVKSVPPVAADESLQNPVRSDRRRSVCPNIRLEVYGQRFTPNLFLPQFR